MKTLCRMLCTGLLLAGLPTALSAQQGVRQVLSLVAGRIAEQSSYKLLDTATRETLAAFPAGGVRPSVRALSNYNDWTYFNGVILSGMLRASDAMHERVWRDMVLQDFNFIFDNLDYFREQWEVLQVKGASFYRVFRMNMLDDCGAMGAALAEAYRYDGQPRFLRMLQRIANYIENVQLRLDDGTLARPDPRYKTIWADDLYMSVPFLVQMATLTGEGRYVDDAVRQVMGFTTRLADPETGLLRHAWFSDSGKSPVAWGRANGWAVLAQTELLKNLPPGHPVRDSLLAVFRRHLTALSRFQDASGLWHQVLDRPDSYLETSCSAMFCYGIAAAVAEGWLDLSYADVARKAWRGVSSRIRPDGQIEGICRGTEVGFDLQFYYERPTPLNDPRGIGAVLLAGAEILRLKDE